MRKARTWGLCLLVLLATAVWTLPVHADGGDATGEQEVYMLVYLQGAKVGWAKATHGPGKLEDRETITSSLHAYISVKRAHDGQVFENVQEEKEWSLPDGQKLRSWSKTRQGEQVTETQVDYRSDSVLITETLDGTARTTTLKREHEDLYSDVWIWDKAKKEGLKAGSEYKWHTVHASGHKFEETRWKIGGVESFKSAEGIEYKGVKITQTTGEETVNTIIGNDGMPIRIVHGVVTVERTPKMPEDFKPDVFEGLANIMHSDVAVPQDKQFTLSEMELHFPFKHDDDGDVPYLADTGNYHDVIKYADGDETGYALKLKHQKLGKDFKSPALPMTDVPEDIQKFMKPTPLCQSDDETLMGVASKQTEGAKDAKDAAVKLCHYVYAYLKKVSGATGSASALQAFKEKKGDCTEHSSLFVALARAAGLPARNCSGLVYVTMSDGKGLFGMHAWSEVWLGRWVPVDATVDEVGTSARYILFHYEEPGITYGEGRSMRLLQQAIKPKIDAYKLEDGKQWVRRFDFSKPLKPKGK